MRTGPAGLTATGTSIGLTVVVAALGPSAMEPPLPGRPGQPPYSLVVHPPADLVVALGAAAILTGTLGLGLCMHAARRGWAPSPRALLAAGIAVAALLTWLPPFGSADHLSYAGYGRMLATGHDPYAAGPSVLGGDPVARAVEDWRTTPSVYGPVATAGQALAALIAGSSVRLTVFLLSLLNLAAFAGAALLLHRLARGDRGRQVRAGLLWTLNPLLAYELIAGGHVDSQAAVFAAAAVAAAVSAQAGPPRRRAAGWAAAGVLAGLGAAVKLTAALAAGGLAWATRRSWRSLAALAAGFALVAAAALAAGGPHLLSQTARGSSFVSIGSPWRATRSVLTTVFGAGTAGSVVSAGSVLLALALAALFLRGLPDRPAGQSSWPPPVTLTGPAAASGRVPAARTALACTLAWLFAWPYVLPWYDALAWVLLPMVAWSWVDWLMLARTAALAVGYLPARGPAARLPADLGWLQSVVRTGVTPAILAALTIVAVVACARRIRPRAAGDPGRLAVPFAGEESRSRR